MRKKRLSKKIATLILAGAMMATFSTTAFAQANPDAEGQSDTATEATAETPAEPAAEQPAEDAAPVEENQDGSGVAFSVPGNAEIQDDVTDGSSKEFLTIRTENNNTFYVIIDRAANTENVYMLSNIDENDLQEFLKDGEKGSSNSAAVVLEEELQTPSVTETPAKETEQPKKSTNTGAMLAILALAGVGIAGYYYFKIYKPKKEQEEYEDENIEMSDGLQTVNEDEEETKESK